MQRTGGPCSRTAPRRHVHHPARQNNQPGHDARAHADALVQRQHRRHANHVGGGAVAIQRYHQCQHGGADADFQRVALDQLEDLAHGRVEQAGVDHQGEIQNGKHQHHPGRGQLGNAFEHHGADLGCKTAEEGKQDRHQNQRDEGGQALGHDQVHERNDHGKAKEGQHKQSPFLLLSSGR